MKKFLTSILALIILWLSVLPASAIVHLVNTTPNAGTNSQEFNFSQFESSSGFDFQFKPATDIWKKLVGNIKPNTFSPDKVHYQLKKSDKIIKVDSQLMREVRSPGMVLGGAAAAARTADQIIANGGLIKCDVLEAAAQTDEVKPGTIFIDETRGTAFKVVTGLAASDATGAMAGNYSVVQPQVSELVDYFELEEDTIELNRANITGFADTKIEKMIQNSGYTNIMETSEEFLKFHHLEDPLIKMVFPSDTTLTGYLGNGQSVSVTLSGGLGLGNLGLTGKYSANGGYRLELSVTQEVFLQVQVATDLNQEVRIPILSIDVPFGIGRVSGGLYVVVQINGNITIELQAREWVTVVSGVRGGTFLYVPTSRYPYAEMPSAGFTGDVAINASIQGVIKAGAMLSLELFGMDMAGAGAFIGTGLKVTGTSEMLDIELFGIFQIYLAFNDKTYNLVYWTPTILKCQQANTYGYAVSIGQACAYLDQVGGLISFDHGAADPEDPLVGMQPAPFLDYRVEVIPKGSSKSVIYPKDGTYWQTDTNGEFRTPDDVKVALENGDKVKIRIRNGTSPDICTDAAPATFPFRDIVVTEADYFNDFIIGQVSPAIVPVYAARPGESKTKEIRFVGDVDIELTENDPYNAFHLAQSHQSTKASTDENGIFSTARTPAQVLPSGPLNVTPGNGFTLHIYYDDFAVSDYSYTRPTVAFEVKRIVEYVPGSYSKQVQNGRVIDRQTYRERIYLINMRGSRSLSSEQVNYTIDGLSTQDALTKGNFFYLYDASSPFSYLQYKAVQGEPIGLQAQKSGVTLFEIADDGSSGSGAAYFNTHVITEWVWQPHPDPTIITSPDHYECTTAGGSFSVTATGVDLLGFQLLDAPTGVTVDQKSGLMTITDQVTAGQYKFKVKADQLKDLLNPVQIIMPLFGTSQKDDDPAPAIQGFTLTVSAETAQPLPTPTVSPTPALTSSPTLTPTPTPAPSLTPSPTPTFSPTLTPTPTPAPSPTPEPFKITSVDNFTCTNRSTNYFQVTTNRRFGVFFSLAATRRGQQIPTGCNIDPDTGRIEIKPGILAQIYHFDVKAQIGLDTTTTVTQPFTLTISNVTINSADNPQLLVPDKTLQIKRTAIHGTPQPDQSTPGNQALISGMATQFVIRNDHELDPYTRQEEVVNGADYIDWQGLVTIDIEEARSQFLITSDSILNDHHKTNLDSDAANILRNKWTAMVEAASKPTAGYSSDSSFLRSDFAGLNDAMVLDCGAVKLRLANPDSNQVDLVLDEYTGRALPGDVFNTLKSYPDNLLRLIQPELQVTFRGLDIHDVGREEWFDFSFVPDAPDAPEMLKAAEGEPAFTYTIGPNLSFPGTARFAVKTNLAPGLKVSVYHYEPANGLFSLIAENLTVGEQGLVSYNNNMTSEYLITTRVLAGAERSDALRLQSSSGPAANSKRWLIPVIAGLVLLITGGIVFNAWRIKNRKNKTRAG